MGWVEQREGSPTCSQLPARRSATSAAGWESKHGRPRAWAHPEQEGFLEEAECGAGPAWHILGV